MLDYANRNKRCNVLKRVGNRKDVNNILCARTSVCVCVSVCVFVCVCVRASTQRKAQHRLDNINLMLTELLATQFPSALKKLCTRHAE